MNIRRWQLVYPFPESQNHRACLVFSTYWRLVPPSYESCSSATKEVALCMMKKLVVSLDLGSSKLLDYGCRERKLCVAVTALARIMLVKKVSHPSTSYQPCASS